jgi:tagatose 6-phosphate kinase
VIIAAGLSPAWQQILLFDRFTPGEVNRATQSHWCASGKVLNVGLGLHSLGVSSVTLSPVGGPAGEMIEREFQACGAPLSAIRCESTTRVCTTILDRATRVTTELVEAAPPLSTAELNTFSEKFASAAAKGTGLVLTGSLPAGTPVTFYRDLLRAAPAIPAILDARGPELLAALECKPLVVKPNREELGITFGRTISDDEALIEAMRELNSRGAGWVVVSAGKQSLLATSVEGAYRLTPPTVADPQNPIGCGDALTAGLAWGLSRGMSPVDAIRLGMAAATDRLRQILPARLDARNVEQIAAGIVTEKL